MGTNVAPSAVVSSVADFLIRWRNVLLVATVVLTAVALGPAAHLPLNQSVESLFAPNDPLLRDYRQSKKWFGGLQLVAVAYTDPALFSEAGRARLRRLRGQLAAVPGVRRAESLLSFLPQNSPSDDDAPHFAAPVRKLIRGTLLGEDGRTTAVLLRLEPEETSSADRESTIAEIRRIARNHDRATVVAGMPVMLGDVFDYLEQDGWSLGMTSTVLLGLVMLFLFRSLRWVILPLALVQAAVLWTKAILFATHVQLSMVSTMLTALVTVIGIATAVHVTMRYRELRAQYDGHDAMRQTILLVGPACFWTCMTTAAGFAALMASRISPVQSFGLMLALGSLLVLAAAALVLPGGVLLGRGVGPGAVPGERRLGEGLGLLFQWLRQRPGTVGLVCTLVLVGAGSGYLRLRIETDFTKNFRASSPIVKAYEFVEQRMGGAGNWEVNMVAPAQLDAEHYETLRKLDRELRGIHGITKVIGMPDVVEAAWSRFPGASLAGPDLTVRGLELRDPQSVADLWNRDARRMRVLLRARERQPAQAKRALYARVRQVANRAFPLDAYRGAAAPRVTGTFVLFMFLIESLMRDQVVTFALATALIALMLTVAFGDWRLALVALVPNGCPILIVIGVMGWLGLKVNMATAMIASVSMGLAVDFSIHYIARYRQERRAGADFYTALERTHQSVGRALVLASIALVAGFSVLCLSNFVPTVNFGILVSVAMLGGLAGNLVVLPLLLSLLDRDRFAG